MGKFGSWSLRTSAVDSRQGPSVERGHVLQNPQTGLGGTSDRSLPHFVDKGLDRSQAERLYRQSWAAAKMIDIPVDDMVVRWRKWSDDSDQKACGALDDLWREFNAREGLTAAMKAGRLFGTGLVIIVPTAGLEAMEEPRPEKMGADCIANFYAVDRWYCEVLNTQQDMTEPGFGLPYQYQVSPQQGAGWSPRGENADSEDVAPPLMVVHHSWVLRFDGVRALSTEGWWQGHESRYWGRSELERAVDEILRDAGMHAGVAQLAAEASLFTIRVHGLKEALKGRPLAGEPTIDELAAGVSNLKSLYRTLFIDAEDEADRINVSFAGLPELIDKQAERLAAIADIPISRFLGRAPTGLQATGKFDTDNYAMRIGALQKRLLDHPVRVIDSLLCEHAGLGEPPEWEWLPLTDLGDKEQAEVMTGRVQSVLAAYQAGLVDEEEGRDALPVDLFGELGPWTPPPEPEMPGLEDLEAAINGANGAAKGMPVRR